MMATIEERASDYFHKLLHNGKDITHSIGGNKAYLQGATDQRDIDIEKATEWINANWRKYIDTDADGMIRFSGWKKDFEKAMKDENENKP